MKTTTVTFVFGEILPKSSTIVLEIHFIGSVNNQMAGFYRSNYKDTKGKDKVVASTQFEALDARRAFPCVDEPSAKATFVVTMIVPASMECFSNMPEASKKFFSEEDDLVEISFLPTPKMSTYLLAFCVGEFDFVQAQTENGVLVRVCAPRCRSASC